MLTIDHHSQNVQISETLYVNLSGSKLISCWNVTPCLLYLTALLSIMRDCSVQLHQVAIILCTINIQHKQVYLSSILHAPDSYFSSMLGSVKINISSFTPVCGLQVHECQSGVSTALITYCSTHNRQVEQAYLSKDKSNINEG